MFKKKYFICFVLCSLLLITACSQYQKVLNKGTAPEQYALATKMYEAKKYNKALNLLEKVTTAYKGKPQMERIQYMIAQSNFNTKDYELSGYYFNRFALNYPKSSKKEEAAFLSAYSYYLDSPIYSLDQTETEKALNSFQEFINNYPDSKRLDEANKYYKALSYKLQKKAFEIAKGYYKTAGYDSRNYKAAIVAFDNLLSDFLGSVFKEEALYYRLKAAHDLALKSVIQKKQERIKEAIAAFDKLKINFPKSKYLVDANQLLADLKKAQTATAKS